MHAAPCQHHCWPDRGVPCFSVVVSRSAGPGPGAVQLDVHAAGGGVAGARDEPRRGAAARGGAARAQTRSVRPSVRNAFLLEIWALLVIGRFVVWSQNWITRLFCFPDFRLTELLGPSSGRFIGFIACTAVSVCILLCSCVRHFSRALDTRTKHVVA